ncbi:SGNH/GDSL hydrolase family protein [Maribacter chungangensis]|uniref:SGNH/GDSL hydrolase family protein n=1 Tax=Maribacter chungangensis TaxID=1069117 RepID=A0ABW3B4C0_9FLAO
MNLKYSLGVLISVPLLPILYVQGKKIKSTVPKLPEAKGNQGSYSVSSERTLSIITIGESTIAGVGVQTHEEGFTGTLAKELATALKSNINWKVHAKSGYTAKRLNDHIIPDITENPVDLIVIGIGGNDAFELSTPKKWSEDVRELIKNLRLKFENVPILFINMPPIKEFPAFTSLIRFTIGNLVDILGKELVKIVADFENVYCYARVVRSNYFIERYKLNITPADFFSDGVHPSKITYQIWAKDVATYIMESKEIKNHLIHDKN